AHYTTGLGLASPGGIASLIADKYHIPTYFNNFASGGSNLELHIKGNSIYTYALWMFQQAGLTNGLSAVIWQQGEANSFDSLNASIGYDTIFTHLCNDWKADYPNLKHVYMFQTHPGCGYNFQNVLRNTQRRCAEHVPFLSVISTTGIVAHDGCHYGQAGYYNMGAWLCPQIGRDLCRSADTLNINSPNIIAAKFDDNAHTILTLQFDVPVILQPDTTSPYGILSVKDFFYLGDDKAGCSVSSASVDTAKHTVTLILKQSSKDSTISYTPNNTYTNLPVQINFEGPYIFSTRGIAALTFFKFPISKNLITTAVKPANLHKGNFQFVMPHTGQALVELYTINGARVALLYRGFAQTGTHALSVDLKKLRSSRYYVVKIKIDGVSIVKPLMVVR
ncbi:MAG: sialate O-acetylesterase, partial [Chitinivibrionales bacterium]|nr:sialate O-acetylesterase [Chitinivibrionales bacterium]